jgi:glycosyltransferase involved in cell wall biosynthesis
MDELSLFRGAPPELVRRERELLAVADVVFAGGPKMWRAKKEYNANCFCFGCGVDAKHFAAARDADLCLPSDLTGIGHPIYGYVGVVDERIDYDLIAALADHGGGNVVMVGPTTKVDPASLPQRRNLHWLGGRDYAQLPAYLKAFDVCLMPFALNDATAFINPTKALEYMATGIPIVSTAIDDVVAQFNEVVAVARNHTDFVIKARAAAATPDKSRIDRGHALVRQNSWESIVRQLEQHIAGTLASKRTLEVNAA